MTTYWRRFLVRVSPPHREDLPPAFGSKHLGEHRVSEEDDGGDMVLAHRAPQPDGLSELGPRGIGEAPPDLLSPRGTNDARWMGASCGHADQAGRTPLGRERVGNLERGVGGEAVDDAMHRRVELRIPEPETEAGIAPPRLILSDERLDRLGIGPQEVFQRESVVAVGEPVLGKQQRQQLRGE
jgi:hypothetical protein